MTPTLILAGILGPALFWILYFYYKDRFKPEPVLHIGITYLLGIIAAYACFKSYGLLPLVGMPEDASIIMDNNRPLFLLYCLAVVGPLEELFKFLPFLYIIYVFKSFDEKIDGLVYASVVAVGFASFENLYYLAHLDGFDLFGRAIASPFTQGIFSSIWGHMVGRAKLAGRSVLKASVIGLAAASLLHGIFDFLNTSPALRLFSAAAILALWIWRLRKFEKLAQKHLAKKKNNDRK